MELAPVFGDNMVLQQGMPVPVWGRSKPGAKVEVRFGGERADAVTDQAGEWRVTLGPLSASKEPRELIASSPEGVAAVSNVLVGEVWLCSGQSNMEWTVSLAADALDEIAQADHQAIRIMTVARRTARKPRRDLPPGSWWRVCSPGTVSDFSAVGYYFGREIHQRLDTPVGLVGSSWGGTTAEAWTSRESLLAHPSLREIVEAFDRNLPHLKEDHDRWLASMNEHEARTADVENAGFARGWAAPDEPGGEWREVAVPGYWQNSGCDFSGVIWYRKAVDVPAEWAGRDLSLAIGATDKEDVTYFGGERVGGLTMAETPEAWRTLRTYAVPGHLVKAGRNVIAVRVRSNKFAGGMTGPADAMRLTCPSLPGAAPIPLSGAWRIAVEKSYGLVELPPEPMAPDSQHAPSALYDGMIAPLVPLAMRGAIWYQGESNASRARQYRTLFSALIRDWRRSWGQELFGFYFVQLANYRARAAGPGPSEWAELREAQAMALALPETGMASAIDIGDAGDIHPANKQEVGRRLALAALHATYGMKDIVPSGPVFKSAAREGGTMRVCFDHADGLHCHGEKVTGFEIAGADGRSVWADARIDGETVVVSSPEVEEPAAVRYAWADNPACSLYNGAGLPMCPFRTDVD